MFAFRGRASFWVLPNSEEIELQGWILLDGKSGRQKGYLVGITYDRLLFEDSSLEQD